MVNSGAFDGLAAPGPAFAAIVAQLAERGAARPKVNFKLRDWLISRQRYWGVPIPIVYCDHCGIVPVPADQLPVLLPELEDYEPTDDARSPLARDPDFVNTTCPRCGGPARRETDTMDTFVCSSWYQFRYASPHDETAPFERAAVDHWLPVDMYVGGPEHAVMHLLYSRFFCKVLNDAGHVGFAEPYATLRNQGMILAEDGTKMSKSKGNVVTPDSVVERYGADSLRLYELFIAPFEQSVAWNDRGVQGCLRFLTRFWGFALGVAELGRAAAPSVAGDGSSAGSVAGGGAGIERVAGAAAGPDGTDVRSTAGGDGAGGDQAEADSRRLLRALHKTVRKVTGDLETLRFNTAVAALMETLNDVLEVWTGRREQLEAAQWHEIAETFVLLLAPMTPHLAEELWQRLGHDSSVLGAPWPVWDEALAADEVVTVVIQVNGKLRDRLEVPVGAAPDDVVSQARAAHNTVRFLEGKQIVKEVYVPGKLVNFVVR
jgi:leucyl-tRNA synthetase